MRSLQVLARKSVTRTPPPAAASGNSATKVKRGRFARRRVIRRPAAEVAAHLDVQRRRPRRPELDGLEVASRPSAVPRATQAQVPGRVKASSRRVHHGPTTSPPSVHLISAWPPGGGVAWTPTNRESRPGGRRAACRPATVRRERRRRTSRCWNRRRSGSRRSSPPTPPRCTCRCPRIAVPARRPRCRRRPRSGRRSRASRCLVE